MFISITNHIDTKDISTIFSNIIFLRQKRSSSSIWGIGEICIKTNINVKHYLLGFQDNKYYLMTGSFIYDSDIQNRYPGIGELGEGYFKPNTMIKYYNFKIDFKKFLQKIFKNNYKSINSYEKY